MLEELFNSMICASCGACTDILCEKCEIATLQANGLPIEFQSEISGLKMKAPNYGMGYSFQYSELGKKITELIKKQKT